MSKLQAKADAKNVNALDSRVSKIMDLMGFEPEEGDYEVSAFSGGWKMRIGLGKVLLKDPNILLLDEPTNHLVSVLNNPSCQLPLVSFFCPSLLLTSTILADT